MLPSWQRLATASLAVMHRLAPWEDIAIPPSLSGFHSIIDPLRLSFWLRYNTTHARRLCISPWRRTSPVFISFLFTLHIWTGYVYISSFSSFLLILRFFLFFSSSCKCTTGLGFCLIFSTDRSIRHMRLPWYMFYSPRSVS